MAVDEKTTQPFGLGPRDLPAKPGEVLGKGEGTITMVFPRKVILNTDDGKRVEFLPGVQEVPAHLAGHDWLRLNGATGYSAEAAAKVVEQSVQEAQTAFDVALENLNAAKQRVADARPAPAVLNDAPVDLSTMTKAQIIAHAAEVHDLDLDQRNSKDELIAAVEEARAAKE
jgi:hypothetical protein